MQRKLDAVLIVLSVWVGTLLYAIAPHWTRPPRAVQAAELHGRWRMEWRGIGGECLLDADGNWWCHWHKADYAGGWWLKGDRFDVAEDWAARNPWLARGAIRWGGKLQVDRRKKEWRLLDEDGKTFMRAWKAQEPEQLKKMPKEE